MHILRQGEFTRPTLLEVKMWHLIISHQGVIWTGTDTARTPERDKTSAKNVALLLFLPFRCIGEGTPTVHALFPGFCGLGMRIARETRTNGKVQYLPTWRRFRPCASWP